jgi:hypothetical protein
MFNALVVGPRAEGICGHLERHAFRVHRVEPSRVGSVRNGRPWTLVVLDATQLPGWASVLVACAWYGAVVVDRADGWSVTALDTAARLRAQPLCMPIDVAAVDAVRVDAARKQIATEKRERWIRMVVRANGIADLEERVLRVGLDGLLKRAEIARELGKTDHSVRGAISRLLARTQCESLAELCISVHAGRASLIAPRS